MQGQLSCTHIHGCGFFMSGRMPCEQSIGRHCKESADCRDILGLLQRTKRNETQQSLLLT